MRSQRRRFSFSQNIRKLGALGSAKQFGRRRRECPGTIFKMYADEDSDGDVSTAQCTPPMPKPSAPSAHTTAPAGGTKKKKRLWKRNCQPYWDDQQVGRWGRTLWFSGCVTHKAMPRASTRSAAGAHSDHHNQLWRRDYLPFIAPLSSSEVLKRTVCLLFVVAPHLVQLFKTSPCTNSPELVLCWNFLCKYLFLHDYISL